jgi:hypothetical protein
MRFMRPIITGDDLHLITKGVGQSLTVRGDDLRVFEALRQMAADEDPEFEDWLRARRPASGTELFTSLLGALTLSDPSPPLSTTGSERPARDFPASPGGRTEVIPVGRRLDTGTDLELKLSTLTRHTAVFAGSGSGKTVFLRRLIEECALYGVSSIVLDSNNDLARLGDSLAQPASRVERRGRRQGGSLSHRNRGRDLDPGTFSWAPAGLPTAPRFRARTR